MRADIFTSGHSNHPLETFVGLLTRHRIEALARHARELESLDVEVAEVDSLEQAIDLFMRKFGVTAVTA